MPRSNLDPVFTGLRLGLHVLLIGLAGFAVVRSFVVSCPVAAWTLNVGIAFVATYLAGLRAARAHTGPWISRRSFALAWVTAITLLWAVLT